LSLNESDDGGKKGLEETIHPRRSANQDARARVSEMSELHKRVSKDHYHVASTSVQYDEVPFIKHFFLKV